MRPRRIQQDAKAFVPGKPWQPSVVRFDIPKPECCERPGCTRPAFCLDHDHETGLIRGWLCKSCNTAIGLLGDNVDGLLNAIAYLRRTKET